MACYSTLMVKLDFEVAVTSSDITLHLNVHKICFSFVKVRCGINFHDQFKV